MITRRRALVSLMSLLAAPLDAAAQAGRVYRIGYLTPWPLGLPEEEIFCQNLVVESRTAEQRHERLPKLAAELLAAKVDVIVTATGMGGLRSLSPDLGPKRLEILKQALPYLKRAAALWCPELPINHEEARQVTTRAQALGIRIQPLEYRAPESWRHAMEALKANPPEAVFVSDCPSLPLRNSSSSSTSRRPRRSASPSRRRCC